MNQIDWSTIYKDVICENNNIKGATAIQKGSFFVLLKLNLYLSELYLTNPEVNGWSPGAISKKITQKYTAQEIREL